METSPEIKEFCQKLRAQHGIVRAMNAEAYRKFLTEALEFRGCYYAFWQWRGISFLSCYRKDRQPMQSEFLPIAQEVFEDGQIHKVGETAFSVEMAQGAMYITDSIANNMGSALADYADKKDEVEQFDIEQTGTGKRMMRQRRNGSN